MTEYQDLITRLDAGYTKPLSTPPEFSEAAAAIRDLLDELENEQARDIHSCGPTCSKSGCVNRRLREQCDELLAALEKVIDASISPKACRIAQEAIASVKGEAVLNGVERECCGTFSGLRTDQLAQIGAERKAVPHDLPRTPLTDSHHLRMER